MLLDHLRVRLEHSDISDNISLKILETVLFLCLHDLDSMGLNNELTLLLNLLLMCLLLSCRRYGLLLESLDWDDVHLNHFRCKLLVDLDLFILSKDWLVNLLLEHFNIRVA